MLAVARTEVNVYLFIGNTAHIGSVHTSRRKGLVARAKHANQLKPSDSRRNCSYSSAVAVVLSLLSPIYTSRRRGERLER